MTDREGQRGRGRHTPSGRLGRLAVAVVVVIGAIASGAVALLITPMQTVTAAGQTIKVGATGPAWNLSGPGELELFGQQIPTTIDFVGPVRPRLVLTQITLSDQLDQFVAGGLDAAASQLKDALISGWEHYFAWQVVVTGLVAIVIFGALAGWLRRPVRGTAILLAIGVVLAEALNLGAIMVTAYTVPSRLAAVDSIQQLVGGVPPPAVADSPAAPHGIHNVVVIGDSTAAGKGNPLVSHPTAIDKACNRSRDAFAADLADSNGWKVTNLACSGASIREGLLGPQQAAGRTLAPQMDNPAIARADLIVVSVGANDVDWSAILGLCAVTSDCSNKAEEAFLQQQLSGFSRDLLQLLSQLQLLKNHPSVVVNQYYDPFPGSIACLSGHGMTNAKKRSLEGDLTAVNTVLAKGAKAAGFRTAVPNFEGHGLCSPQPYVQGLQAKAPFHPTASGQLAIALAVEDSLHAPPGSTPTTSPGTATPPGTAPVLPTVDSPAPSAGSTPATGTTSP